MKFARADTLPRFVLALFTAGLLTLGVWPASAMQRFNSAPTESQLSIDTVAASAAPMKSLPGSRLRGDLRWIVLASRTDKDAAIGIARGYTANFTGVQVVRMRNRRYAVIAGPEPVRDPRAFKEELVKARFAPKDVRLSNGSDVVALVWRHRDAVLAQVVLEGREAHLSYEDLSITLMIEDDTDKNEQFIRAVGRVASKDVFSLEGGRLPKVSAEVRIVRLDTRTAYPQVVFSYFTGGAHCCMATLIVTSVGAEWRVLDAGTLDGEVGYEFEDLDADGGNELLSGDNRFLYAFEGYAGSFMPARVQKLAAGELLDVTHRPEYLAYHRQHLAVMTSFVTRDQWRTNGFLAAWVAQKSLVGEGREAWRTAVRFYDQHPDFGSAYCLKSAPVEQCPRMTPAGYWVESCLRSGLPEECPDRLRMPFPRALRAFLSENGYD